MPAGRHYCGVGAAVDRWCPNPPPPPRRVGGLLFPYEIGVVAQLQELGVMTPSTQVAGASAGSLIAAVFKSGLPVDTVR